MKHLLFPFPQGMIRDMLAPSPRSLTRLTLAFRSLSVLQNQQLTCFLALCASETRCGTALALEIIGKELSADGRAVTRRYRIQRTPGKWGGQEIPRDRVTGKGSAMNCPYLLCPTDPQVHDDQLVPARCGDPVSGFSILPGFWEYWNRCRTSKHILCRRYRRHQRHSAPGQLEARSSLRRSA
ncbi:MAG TPA: hypothetical protein VFM04_01520 [Candidatus Methylomirabilis sp.]|nr:hypothetical protein [Candidatus Methylomirabilis sp.]